MFKKLYLQARQALQVYLGLSEIPIDGKALNFSEDQKKKVTEAFGADFLTAFTDATAKFIEAEAAETDQAKKAANDAIKALQAEIENLNKANAQQAAQIDQLADQPVADHKAIVVPAAASADVVELSHSANSTHLFDANKLASFKGPREKSIAMELMAIDEKRIWNMNAHKALLEQQGFSIATPNAEIDYSQLADDFNKYWKLIRNEIRTLPYIQSQFDGLIEMRPGISDKAVGFNLFLDELSQAYQKGFVVKGGFKFEPETQEVKDVEIAYEFEDLKELESNWIGMITGAAANSSPIKLSFVAYLAQHMIEKMIMERDDRTSNGRYKAPVQGVAGKAINAADGIYEVLNDKIAELKVRQTVLGLITDANIYLKVQALVESIPQVYRNRLQLTLWLPEGFKLKYNESRKAYWNSTTPNTSPIDYVENYKNIMIRELPYSSGRMRMFITSPKNMTRLENRPNEAITGMRMKEEIKSIKLNSVWKEGFMFHLAGRKAASAEELATRDLMQQVIWCNEIDFDPEYYLTMEKGDATPSVQEHTSIMSDENESVVTITNIDDAPVGKEIRVKAGFNNSIQINATGNFELLTSNWVPNQGDVIILKKRTDGKFIELERIDASVANAVQLPADATTANADNGEFFITSANTEATAITDITNATSGVVYKIQGGSATNPTTIANAGNFVLTAAITLNVGVWIELQKSATNGKFYEIRRSA
jgi:hypothetical protein